jgi:outer membrane protein OmpA-like peptidoglycan-associated protein
MKNRALVTLFLSTVFPLSTFAQQTNANPNAQPAAQSANTICKEPLQPATSNDPWNGEEPNFANLVRQALTRKKDVQGQIQPIRNCLNELDDAAATNTKMVREVDASAHQGIQLASAKTKEADQHTLDATDRTTAAKQAASQLTTHVSTVEQVVGNVDQYKAGAQTEIHFRPGGTVLSKTAKEALDAMAAPLKTQRNYVIEVRGYSPGQGHAAIANSQKMADSVVRYLVLNQQIPIHRIYMVGMGNAPMADDGGKTAKHTTGGQVEIIVLKNDLVSSVQH